MLPESRRDAKSNEGYYRPKQNDLLYRKTYNSDFAKKKEILPNTI